MKNETNHDKYMNAALEEAKIAFEEGEVPVGAIIVKNGEIIGRGHNHRETKNDIASHAEIEAIRDAEQHLGEWSLEGCSLYVTVEPCLMCSGAIKQARITAVYYGADDPSMGAIKSHYHVFDESNVEFDPLVYSGIKEAEASKLMKDFFASRRGKAEKE